MKARTLLLASLVLAACSGSDDAAGPAAGPVVRFHLGSGKPDLLEVPFPSDVYLANGHVGEISSLERVFPRNAQFLSHELGKMDGFSRIAMTSFYIDDPSAPAEDDGSVAPATIDPRSLPAREADCVADGSSVFLLDMEASDPSKARVPCRARVHVDGAFSTARPSLAVGPARGIVLEEGHHYAAVITSRVKDDKGRSVGEPAELASTTNDVYRKAVDGAKSLLAGALAADGAAIVGIAPFTTAHMTDELFVARDAIDQLPVPSLAWDAASLAPMGAAKFAKKDAGGSLPAGFTASLDDYLGTVDPKNKLDDGTDDPDATLAAPAHDKIAALGTAAFEAASFLQDKGGYDALDHATFAHDASGKPIPAPEKPTAKIWVTFAIPDAPMPADGYPVVIVQHGMSSSRQYLFGLANSICKKGWVAVAIDSVTFGARAPEPQYQKDEHTDYETNPGATYRGPDGISDVDSTGARNGSFDLFGGLKNIGALRDQIRQAALDTTQLVRVLRSSPDLSALQTGATAPKLDPARVVYVGNSLGGIEGTIAASIEPNVKAWMLNVAGGGLLTELASHGPGIAAQLSAAAGINFGINGAKLNESHPLVSIVQTVADPGDPISYAAFLVKSPHAVGGAPTSPRNVLQTEVVYDELVSNEAGEALARAAGFGLATPNVGSNAEVLDLAHPEASVGRVPLPDVAPSADGTIHDTPSAGITAVLVQTSPAHHSADLTESHATRRYAAPYGRFSEAQPFPSLDTPFTVPTSYRAMQTMMLGFFDDALQSKVPRVSGFTPPVRDFDADGAPDATDPDPNDPNVK